MFYKVIKGGRLTLIELQIVLLDIQITLNKGVELRKLERYIRRL